MLVIGQEINIFNPTVFKAIKDRDGSRVRGLVKRLLSNGVDGIEINLGGWQGSIDVLPWLVRQVRAVTERPLLLSPIPGSLKVATALAGPGTMINCVTADEKRLESMLSAAMCLDCKVVVLLTKRAYLPSSLDEICLLGEEVIERAERCSFPLDRLILDPVLRPRISLGPRGKVLNRPDITLFSEGIFLLGSLRKNGIGTIAALSNLTTGLDEEARKGLELSSIDIFKMAGLDYIILRGGDKDLVKRAKGNSVQELTFRPYNLDFDQLNGVQTGI